MDFQVSKLNVDGVARGKHKRMRAFGNDPIANALASKLVEPLGPRPIDSKGRRQIGGPDETMLHELSDITGGNISDATSLQQLLPEVELCKQLLISSILSPNDMINTELNFSLGDGDINTDLTGKMLSIIKDYFENVYRIKNLLPTMLREILFTHGSYPMAVLPEASVDAMVNAYSRVSNEDITNELNGSDDLYKDLGILASDADIEKLKESSEGIAVTYSMESHHLKKTPSNSSNSVKKDTPLSHHIVITDNPNILKMPVLQDMRVSQAIHDKFSINRLGFENMNPGDANAVREEDIYPRRTFNHIPIMPAPKLSDLENKENVGHPLVMRLPSESVIPVHVPGSPEEHIGYYVLLDATGYPVTRTSASDYHSDLRTNLYQNKEMLSQLIATTRRGSQGVQPDERNRQQMDQAVNNYTEIVESELLMRLRSGIYGEHVEISRPTEIYRVMLSRALARQQTRILYIPKQLMTYFAFSFNDSGIGKSLTEDTKIIAGIRAILLFANTMGAVKNSIGRVKLNIDLDPEDPDPTHTVEQLFMEYVRTRQRAYPIGASNPLDILDYLQAAGVDVAVSGNEGYPETQLSVEDYTSSKSPVDQDLDEEMKRRLIMAYSLAPETVELSMNVDFATSIVSSNIQLTKRVMMYQDMFCTFLREFVVMYCVNSGHIIDALEKLVVDNKNLLPESLINESPRKVIKVFLTRLQVTLPRPDTVKLENQMAAFDTYSQALETVVDAYISETFMDPEIYGELSDTVESTKQALIAYFKRNWLRNNNVLPEMEALVIQGDEDTFDLLELHDSHMRAMAKSLLSFMKKSLKRKEVIDRLMQEWGAEDEEGADSGEEGGEGEGEEEGVPEEGEDDAEGEPEEGDDAGGEEEEVEEPDTGDASVDEEEES